MSLAAVTDPPRVLGAGLARQETVILAPLEGRAPRHVPVLVMSRPAAVFSRAPEPPAVHAHLSAVGATVALVP